jgi:hypothetical protein
LPQKPECLSLWALHERLQAGEKVWEKVWSLYLSAVHRREHIL